MKRTTPLRPCESRIKCARVPRSARGAKLCPEDVDQRQLRLGIQVEREHGGTRVQACAIALDHLAEDKHYYTKLKKARL